MPARQAFGRSLAEARRQAGLTQAQLGAPLYTRSYVSLLESGARPPTEDVLAHVAERLGLPIEQVRSWTLATDVPGLAPAAALQAEAAVLLLADLPEALGEPQHQRAPWTRSLQGRSDLWWTATFLRIEPAIHRGDFDHAVRLARLLLRHELAADFPVLEGRTRTRLSLALRGAGNEAAALEESALAVELLRSTPDGLLGLLPALAVHVWGLTLADRVPEALALAPELEGLARNSPVRLDQADALRVLGDLHRSAALPEQALEHYLRSGACYDRVHHLARWATVRLAAARTSLDCPEPVPELDEVLSEARTAYTILQDPGGLAQVDVVSAALAARLARWSEARDALDQVARDALPPECRALYHRTRAEVLAAAGEHHSAAEHFDLAVHPRDTTVDH